MSDETVEEREHRRGFRLWMLLPAMAALVVVGIFAAMLGREGANDLPSPLMGKPVPDFELPPLRPGGEGLATADLKEPGVKLVNIWASWCVPCRVEAPELERLAEMGVTIHGINYKDKRADALEFLEALGDPFTRIGVDDKGRAGIEWGVYGVPETFVVDGAGRIVYKHIGPIQNDDIERRILPAIEKASG